MSNRRRFSAAFKARVALDALSGEHTISELASKHSVHPNQISTWKKQAKAGIVEFFSGKTKNSPQNNETKIKDLHAKIGQLLVEKDFLQQAFVKI
jgi:transposase